MAGPHRNSMNCCRGPGQSRTEFASRLNHELSYCPQGRSVRSRHRLRYNVQVAVDTEHHLIIAHEVTNSGSDRAQLSNIASQAKEDLGVDELQVVADRGYYSGEEILECHKADIAVTLPKPMTSGIEARGRFGQTGLTTTSEDGDLLDALAVYRCHRPTDNIRLWQCELPVAGH